MVVCRLGLFFRLNISEFQIFFLVFKFGYEDFCGYFLGVITNWTKFRGHFYAF